jgi:hypothetical protein
MQSEADDEADSLYLQLMAEVEELLEPDGDRWVLQHRRQQPFGSAGCGGGCRTAAPACLD